MRDHATYPSTFLKYLYRERKREREREGEVFLPGGAKVAAYLRLGIVYKHTYRAPGKSMYFLLSRTQAGQGRTVKQEQEDISRNHIQTFSGYSVHSRGRQLALKVL